MEVYLVGGAVRDALLGLRPKERDWVVVGATVEEMLDKGFQPVGEHFPVFLHPETKEEYALARTEKKIAKGYKGFSFYADPSITLEQDLKRRDLTINAIAQDSQGKYIDPYGGMNALQAKKLEHVSDAFVEDPVRILRLARFYARFYDKGFTISSKTKHLASQMIEKGEIEALTPERVWQEIRKALETNTPKAFFDCLQELKVLPRLMPMLDLDKGWSDFDEYCKQTTCPKQRWALWLKAVSPSEEAIQMLGKRLKVPKAYTKLAQLFLSSKEAFNATKITSQDFLSFIEKTDALRQPERFKQIIELISIYYSKNAKIMESVRLLPQILEYIRSLPVEEKLKENPGSPKQIIKEMRLEVITEVLKKNSKG